MEGAGSARVFPLRFRFGPLVGAAREYAGRHRVLLAAVVVVVGGGAAAGGILATRSSYVATRPIHAALVRWVGGAGSSHRKVIVQIGVPTIVRFVPHATFAISFYLRNQAGAPVTVERVRAALPTRAPLRQVGTRLWAAAPFVCRSGSCPYIDPIGSPPYGAERPVPLTVAPGHWALARLDFQFAACTSRPGERGTARKITIVYRTPDGTLIHQRLALGNSTPHLIRTPSRAACR